MPNGWLFSISNEVYEDSNGHVYEIQGIPPDVVPTADFDPLLVPRNCWNGFLPGLFYYLNRVVKTDEMDRCLLLQQKVRSTMHTDTRLNGIM